MSKKPTRPDVEKFIENHVIPLDFKAVAEYALNLEVEKTKLIKERKDVRELHDLAMNALRDVIKGLQEELNQLKEEYGMEPDGN